MATPRTSLGVWILVSGRRQKALGDLPDHGSWICSFASNPITTPDAVSVIEAMDLLAVNLSHPGHVFWADDLDLRLTFPVQRTPQGYRQVTDAYLLGLAIHHKAHLVTLDGGIGIAGTRRASNLHSSHQSSGQTQPKLTLLPLVPRMFRSGNPGPLQAINQAFGMAYQVLARKSRPQKFADVAGQEHVTRTLVNALEQGRIAHGYIFRGIAGLGRRRSRASWRRR